MKKASLIIFIIVAAVLTAPVAAFAAGSVPQKILDLRPSIVRVVDVLDNGSFSMGTGWPIGTDAPVQYIVTNNHVIEQNTGMVRVWYGDHTFINATVEVQKPDQDLAVLKLENPITDMQPLTINDRSDSKTGDEIYALGFPASADSFSKTVTANADEVTVTDGIISSIKSTSITQNGSSVKLLQVNAAVNPGNSGGPLLNGNGEVIGINSYAAQNAQNINAAISVDELVGILKAQNIPYIAGKSPQVEPLTAEAAAPKTANSMNVIMIVAAEGALVVVVLALVATRRRRTYFALEKWLDSTGGRVPFEEALAALEPVIGSLAEMHAKGRCHLDICPEKILVHKKTFKGVLLKPDKVEKIGCKVMIRPGYSPEEQYKDDGDIGPWSDVYAIGAVLYLMVNGAAPPDAIVRMDDDFQLPADIANRLIDEDIKLAWLDSMRMQPGDRIADCAHLAAQLYSKTEFLSPE